MGAQMNRHLGYLPGPAKPEGQTNERNGASGKTIITDHGPLRAELPWDRRGSFGVDPDSLNLNAFHRL